MKSPLYDRVHIVVVDDICRFAVHLTRFFDGAITTGIGTLTTKADRNCHFFKSDSHTSKRRSVPMKTGDPRIFIWWIPADGTKWRPVLEDIQDQIRGETAHEAKTIFLIDIKGEGDYNPLAIYEALPHDDPSSYQWFITSYETDVLDDDHDQRVPEIKHKSPATFRELRRAVYQKLRRPKPSKSAFSKANPRLKTTPSTIDILVTGAGFERQATAELEIGVRPTAEILALIPHLLPPPKNSGNNPPFPLPHPYNSELHEAAAAHDLDAYWDHLIQREYDLQLKEIDAAPEKRSHAKVLAHRHSLRLRNAYRQAMLRDDWGIMKQSLDASSLPWTAWLTTNYTRFADRAIQLKHRHRQMAGTNPGRDKRWRIIATATEASILMRELLFEVEDGNQRQSQSEAVKQVLFKLHGDISHIHTMAIAGQDKELFSTTGLPLDNLSLIYQAAQRHLMNTIEAKNFGKGKTFNLHWHIVGHRMNDQLLCETLYRISRFAMGHGGTCRFIFVSPGSPIKSKENFEEYLKNNRKKFSKRTYYPIVQTDAHAYISQLRVNHCRD